MEQLKQQLKELQDRVDTIEQAQNLNQNVLLKTALFGGAKLITSVSTGAYGADLQRTIDTGSTPIFSIPENPINAVLVDIGGTRYRILLYSLT